MKNTFIGFFHNSHLKCVFITQSAILWYIQTLHVIYNRTKAPVQPRPGPRCSSRPCITDDSWLPPQTVLQGLTTVLQRTGVATRDNLSESVDLDYECKATCQVYYATGKFSCRRGDWHDSVTVIIWDTMRSRIRQCEPSSVTVPDEEETVHESVISMTYQWNLAGAILVWLEHDFGCKPMTKGTDTY